MAVQLQSPAGLCNCFNKLGFGSVVPILYFLVVETELPNKHPLQHKRIVCAPGFCSKCTFVQVLWCAFSKPCKPTLSEFLITHVSAPTHHLVCQPCISQFLAGVPLVWITILNFRSFFFSVSQGLPYILFHMRTTAAYYINFYILRELY